jgi:hypothetical protein
VIVQGHARCQDLSLRPSTPRADAPFAAATLGEYASKIDSRVCVLVGSTEPQTGLSIPQPSAPKVIVQGHARCQELKLSDSTPRADVPVAAVTLGEYVCKIDSRVCVLVGATKPQTGLSILQPFAPIVIVQGHARCQDLKLAIPLLAGTVRLLRSHWGSTSVK